MADLIDQLNSDLTSAVRLQDGVAVSTLRMLLSSLHNAKIAKGSELTDDEVLAEIAKDAKRHKESIAAFEKGARDDLAIKEKAELAMLLKYLPAQLSEGEIQKIVDEVILEINPTGISDMGKVMSAVMTKAGKGADGAVVSSIVRAKLTNDKNSS